MLRRFLKRLLFPPMVILAAFIMFVEEWLWDHLTAVMALIARARVVRAVEKWLAALPPYAAAAAFILPGLFLLPVKLAALYLVAHKHAVAGICLIGAAKIVGTACAARLYSVCQPALLSLNWFRWIRDTIIRVKTWLYAAIKSLPGWTIAVRWKQMIKARLSRRGFILRRWRAVSEVVRTRMFR